MITNRNNIRALLLGYYCTIKFKVAMAMDQFIERFKTLRVHCSVTLHQQQIEMIFCTINFKVAMAMDQFKERFKTLRVHRSVTLHRQQIETIFCSLLYIFVFTFHFTFHYRDRCNPCYGI